MKIRLRLRGPQWQAGAGARVTLADGNSIVALAPEILARIATAQATADDAIGRLDAMGTVELETCDGTVEVVTPAP